MDIRIIQEDSKDYIMISDEESNVFIEKEELDEFILRLMTVIIELRRGKQ